MKWLIVVIFATAQGDVYIFNKPTFNSRAECMQSVMVDRDILLQKLLIEYGRPLPIRGVNCLDENTINDIMNKFHLHNDEEMV